MAAILSAAGVWLGDNLDGACFEDVDIAFAIERRLGLHRRAILAARYPGLSRMALTGSDVGHLRRVIERRDADHAIWGFKRPGILPRLGRDGLRQFRNPVAVLCFRDPIGLAQRLSAANGMEMSQALRYAKRELKQNMKIVDRLPCPTLLVSFEKLTQVSDALLHDVFEFCGLDISPNLYPFIRAEAERAGEKYKRLASAPIVGYIDRPLSWSLSGWCCPTGSKGPTAVDVFADGVRLTTTIANLCRPDLLPAGFRSAHHGFEVDLRKFDLEGGEVIDVRVSGSNVKLEDSGYVLGRPADQGSVATKVYAALPTLPSQDEVAAWLGGAAGAAALP